MSELNKLYKCEICGIMVQVVKDGDGRLFCCGKPMVEQIENTEEASTEKHIPVIEKADGGVLVKIGSIEHPMIEEHHIELIELYDGDKVYRKYLKANEKPEAFFEVEYKEGLIAKEYCNIHGYWTNK